MARVSRSICQPFASVKDVMELQFNPVYLDVVLDGHPAVSTAVDPVANPDLPYGAIIRALVLLREAEERLHDEAFA
eukprot:13991166-Alexandrium_andersonii.AAC.1